MKVDGTHYCSLRWNDDGALRIIGQRWLPHDSRVTELNTLEDRAFAIRDMWVRGAPLIGATATCAMALRMAVDPSEEALNRGWDHLHATRPTAINLRWDLDRCRGALLPLPARTHAEAALALAHAVADEDVEINRRIGEHGLALNREIPPASRRASRCAC